MLDGWLLKAIIDKKAREVVYLGSESSIDNDDMYFKYDDNGVRCHINRIEGNKVIVTCYPKEDSDESFQKEVSFKELSSKEISILHHYKLWRLEYSSLLEAVLKNRLRYNKIKWWLASKNEKKVLNYYEKHTILSLVVANRDFSNKVSFYTIKKLIYGVSSEQRSDYSHNADLRWKLSALKESGDISFDDKILYLENIVVNPQALNTLSDFQRDEQKHKDSIKMARTQQLFALLLFVSAAVNVYFTHFVTANG